MGQPEQNMPDDSTPPTLPEMRKILGELTPDDPTTKTAFLAEKSNWQKMGYSLGHMGMLAESLCTSLDMKSHEDIQHPRMCLFVASHGGHEDKAQAATFLDALAEGTSPVNALCQSLDADLSLYDLALEHASAPTTPRLSEQETAEAMAYGMMVVEPGVDLLIVSILSDGAGEVAQSLAENLSDQEDALETLFKHGGRDIAAVTGLLIAAQFAKIPVVLDGDAAACAYKVLQTFLGRDLENIYLAAPTDMAAGAPVVLGQDEPGTFGVQGLLAGQVLKMSASLLRSGG